MRLFNTNNDTNNYYIIQITIQIIIQITIRIIIILYK